MLALGPAHCRQLFLRSQKHLASDRARFSSSSAEHRRLLREFHAAAQSGDTAGLRQIFSEEVVAYNDGGGRVRAARNPVYGADRVARLYVGLAAKFPDFSARARLVEINAAPALLVRLAGNLQVISIDVEGGRIRNLYAVANPDKLAHLARHLPETN